MGAETLHDLTPAYALDALDADERSRYEEHLAQCEQCRTELASFAETATALAYAVDAPAPPPQLRDRILANARAERPNVVPLRPRWAVPAAVTAAVAVAATIALAVWAAALSGRLDRERDARSAEQRVAAILGSPNARAFAAGRSKVVVTPSGDAALVVARLQPARTGMTYEAWVASGGAPRPAGTFDAGRNVTAVALDRPVPRGATVMVTEEKHGGTSAPTHMPLIRVDTS
jgi:anti-sigma factor RsiW